jgi:hypothetical protein
MKFSFRTLLAMSLAAAGALACAESPTTARFSPQAAKPTLARIRATDSLMMVTEVTFSDTALVLTRIKPLEADISVSAVIGRGGGSIRIDQAGGKIDIPAGALDADTRITMTALAGANVTYEFQPHGLTFKKPVKVQQFIAGTSAADFPTLLKGMHGSYYDQTALDSAFVDRDKKLARVKEHQLGYLEANASQIKFYIEHFSGYLVSCGRDEKDATNK